MATYVGGTSNVGTGASYTVSLNGTLTGGSNSSPSQGDLILVFTGEANSASVTSTCSGNNGGSYSTIRAHKNSPDTHDANLDSFYKFAGATPDTTLTITRGNNNTTYGSGTVVHVWRGIDPTTPFNVTPTVASGTNGSAANPPAITPTIAGSIVLYVGHASQLAASGTVYTTAGTYPISIKGDGSTGDSIIMASHYTAWTSGAYDPAAFTGSTTTTALAWVGLTIVLAPFVRSLTCNSGSYTYTGSSATITRTYNGGVVLQSAYNVDDSSGNGTTLAATLNGVTAGSTLVAFVGFGDTGTITCSVSDGTSYTAAADGKRRDTVNNQSSQVFYLPNAGSGNHTITATLSTLTPYRRIRVFEIAGLATSTIEDGAAGQFQTNVGTTTDSISSTATGTTSNANDFVLGLTQDTGNLDPGTGTMAAGTGFTLIGTNQILAAEYKNVTSTGAQTATFTDSKNSNRTTHVLVLKTLVTGPTNYSVIAQSGSYTYSGSSATITRNRSLSASAGSYTYTGSSAVLTKGAALNHRSLTANAGSYTYTGSTATLVRGRSLSATAGSYSYSGQSATIRRNRSLTASSGSYTYTGQSATILRGRSLSASAGSYAYSGQSAALSRGRSLTAQAGSYAITGSSSDITIGAALNHRYLTASPGSYYYNGSTATLLLGRSLTASPGSYTYTGSSADINKGLGGYSIVCEPGSYLITGSSATITAIVTSLSEASILAIAQAVWERGLPLTSEPVVTYGTTELTQRDLNAISHAVWSRTL